jgi:hypothetical protein
MMVMIENFPISNSEKIHYTNMWCREQGIKNADLGTVSVKDGKIKHNSGHPAIDDVILLRNWKKEFHDCPHFWKKSIERIWDYVYRKKCPMKKSHLGKLQKITLGIIKWRQTRTEQITKIKNIRQG